MRCPKCNGETGVKDSRPKAGNRVWRRHFCYKKKCGNVFTTYELLTADYSRGFMDEYFRNLEAWKKEIFFRFMKTFEPMLKKREGISSLKPDAPINLAKETRRLHLKQPIGGKT